MTLQELNKSFQLQQKLQQDREVLESLKVKVLPGACQMDGMPMELIQTTKPAI